MRALAREEIESCTQRIPELEENKLLLIPADLTTQRMQCLRYVGHRGDEAALFAGDLFRMYQKYAESKGWQLAVSSVSEGASGGYKEIVCTLTGEGVYGTMKYESGVHRVQRVPPPKRKARTHVSGHSGCAARGRGV